ncbi:hypothetical protein GCM10027360_95270 [Amycolatopsis echigonensis]
MHKGSGEREASRAGLGVGFGGRDDLQALAGFAFSEVQGCGDVVGVGLGKGGQVGQGPGDAQASVGSSCGQEASVQGAVQDCGRGRRQGEVTAKDGAWHFGVRLPAVFVPAVFGAVSGG